MQKNATRICLLNDLHFYHSIGIKWGTLYEDWRVKISGASREP